MFRVVVPLVIARAESGRDVYLYQGAPVPDGLADGQVERLAREGFILADPEPVEPSPDQDPEPNPKRVEDMTVEELKAYAEAHSIDLGEATRKADILATIQAAPAAE